MTRVSSSVFSRVLAQLACIVYGRRDRFLTRKLLIESGQNDTTKPSIVLTEFSVDLNIVFYHYGLASHLAKKFSASVCAYIPNIYYLCRHTRLPTLRKLISNIGTISAILKTLNVKPRLSYLYVQSYFRDIAEVEGKKFFESLASKEDLLRLRRGSVALGVHIYDSYLRKYSVATVNLSDRKLLQLIIEAFTIYYTVREFFRCNGVAAVVVGHTTYNDWGILAQIAGEHKVNVYLTYNSDPYAGYVRLSHRSLRAFGRVLTFPSYFIKSALFECQSIEERTRNRIRGCEYIRLSTKFAKVREGARSTRNERKNENRDVILFCHALFDSPHAYGDMVFADFFEWIRFTDQAFKPLKQQGFALFLRPHPQRFREEDSILKEIVKNTSCMEIDWSESNVSNVVASNPAAILSCYGTCIHEYTFYGVPVITCSPGPADDFGLGFRATTSVQYESLIHSIPDLKVSYSQRRRSAEYAYCHYLAQRDALNGLEYPVKPCNTGRESKEDCMRILGNYKQSEADVFIELNEKFFDSIESQSSY